MNKEQILLNVERYKYIISELSALNKQVFSILNVFQGLSVVLLGAGGSIYLNWSSGAISGSVAQLGLKAVVAAFAILCAFAFISIFSTILSWVDYRHEETKLLNDIFGTEYRSAPTWRNCYRWSETWIIIFMFVLYITVHCFVIDYLLPSII